MGVIKYQKKENMAFEILPNGVKRAEMLPGMVEGVHTYKCQVKAGETVELEVFGDITQLIYITSGECYITTRDKAFMVTEPSLFIPNMDLEKNVLHAVTDVEYLQLTCVMLPMDVEWWGKWHISLPRFCPLSQCIQYTEGFRPDGIKAYSILDTHWITRMTMGAIIGKGPNKAIRTDIMICTSGITECLAQSFCTKLVMRKSNSLKGILHLSRLILIMPSR